MKHLLLALCLATPAAADPPVAPPSADLDKGVSLMEEGAKLLLRGLITQIEPSLKDMNDALDQARPQIMDLLAKIDDLRNYHAPEIQQNGDILIRRKTPAELKLEGLSGPKTDL